MKLFLPTSIEKAVRDSFVAVIREFNRLQERIGTVEKHRISTDSSGIVVVFDYTYYHLPAISITPTSNTSVWYTDLTLTSVKIHSASAADVSVIITGV